MNKMDFFSSDSVNKDYLTSKEELDQKLKGRIRPAFGIDLGTTNSAISVIISMQKPEPIQLISGKKTMPSCVLWNGHEEGFIVGEEAYSRIDETEHCVYSIKRYMQDPNYVYTFRHNGEEITMTPAEISAEILKALVKQTNGMYGDIEDVVVTVPAYFNTTGRAATIEACKLAGLNLLGLLVEPSSAALTYNLDKDESKNIIVYDLGGGTFDISLIRLSSISENEKDDLDDIYGFDDEDNFTFLDDEKSKDSVGVETHYKVIDTNGDACLGGDDYDLALYSIVEQQLKDKDINTAYLSDSFRAGMIRKLEIYKKEDIDSDYQIPVNTILQDPDKTVVQEKVYIRHNDFVTALMPTYNRTVKLLKQLINKYETQYPISDIVLVGGSTKSTILREMLKKDFYKYRINCNAEPDLSVALGAAISAKVIKFGDGSIKIFDALSLAISVKEDDILVPIIHKAEELPARGKKVYTTMVDNQKSIAVELYQGNTKLPEEAAYLGSIEIKDIAPKPAGEPNIIVNVSVDVNGILRCKTVVDNVSKDITLQLKSDVSTKTLSRDDKRMTKWKIIINKLTNKSVRDDLLKLLSGYPESVDAKEVRSRIKIAVNMQEWEQTLNKLGLDSNKKKLKSLIKNYPDSINEDVINNFIMTALAEEAEITKTC